MDDLATRCSTIADRLSRPHSDYVTEAAVVHLRAAAADLVDAEAALAAKDAEIERLTKQRDVFADTINALEQQRQAAEAEVARLKIVARDYVGGWREREKAAIATERERCARVVMTFGYSERLENIADAIRAGEPDAALAAKDAEVAIAKGNAEDIYRRFIAAEAARKIAEAALIAKPNPLAVDQLNLAWGCLQQIVDTFARMSGIEIAGMAQQTIDQMKELSAPCPAEPQ